MKPQKPADWNLMYKRIREEDGLEVHYTGELIYKKDQVWVGSAPTLPDLMQKAEEAKDNYGWTKIELRDDEDEGW